MEQAYRFVTLNTMPGDDDGVLTSFKRNTLWYRDPQNMHRILCRLEKEYNFKPITVIHHYYDPDVQDDDIFQNYLGKESGRDQAIQMFSAMRQDCARDLVLYAPDKKCFSGSSVNQHKHYATAAMWKEISPQAHPDGLNGYFHYKLVNGWIDNRLHPDLQSVFPRPSLASVEYHPVQTDDPNMQNILSYVESNADIYNMYVQQLASRMITSPSGLPVASNPAAQADLAIMAQTENWEARLKNVQRAQYLQDKIVALCGQMADNKTPNPQITPTGRTLSQN